MDDRQAQSAYAVALGAIAVAGFAIVIFATHWGIATSSDSARYIRSARHVLGREAVVQSPIEAPAEQAHYPPGYSTLLTLASLGGADPQDAARWLGALLMAANVIVSAELVRRATQLRYPALFVAGWIATAPSSLFIHIWALSEPLFMLLMLLALGALASHLARPRLTMLIAAGLFSAAALLTRYVGVCLIPTGLAAILLLSHKRAGKLRVRDALIFLAVSILPPALWSVRNALVLGSSTNRVLAFHPITLSHFGDAAQTFCDWLFVSDSVSKSLRTVATLIVAAVLIAAIALIWRRARGSILAGISLLFIAAFALTLVWSISFVDFHTPIDVRILSPIYFAWLILLGFVLAAAVRNAGFFATTPLVAAILFGVVGILRSIPIVLDMHSNGAGFARAAWRNSPIIAAIRNVPADEIIYTNAPGAVYLLTQHPIIITIPSQFSASSRLPNPEYADSMTRIADDLHARRAVIAYLKRYARTRWYYPTEPELKKALGLHPLARKSDGTLWDYVAPTTTHIAATAPTTRD